MASEMSTYLPKRGREGRADLRDDSHARGDHELVVDEEAGARITQLGERHKLAEAPVAGADRKVVVGVCG